MAVGAENGKVRLGIQRNWNVLRQFTKRREVVCLYVTIAHRAIDETEVYRTVIHPH